MINAQGVEKVFVGDITIKVEKRFKAVFNEHDEMIEYKDQLEAALVEFVKNFAPLKDAKTEVYVGSYACGTMENLAKEGHLP